MGNPLSKLAADELALLDNAVTPALTSISTGDGTPASLLGAAVSLQGSLITHASLFQKVGVNDLGGLLLAGWQAALEKAKANAGSA